MSAEELYWDSGNGDMAKFHQLLVQGIDPNGFENSDGWTPLWIASCNGQTHIVRELVDSGAQINVQAKKLLHSFDCCCKRKQVDCVKALLEAGADPNVKTNQGDACCI